MTVLIGRGRGRRERESHATYSSIVCVYHNHISILYYHCHTYISFNILSLSLYTAVQLTGLEMNTDLTTLLRQTEIINYQLKEMIAFRYSKTELTRFDELWTKKQCDSVDIIVDIDLKLLSDNVGTSLYQRTMTYHQLIRVISIFHHPFSHASTKPYHWLIEEVKSGFVTFLIVWKQRNINVFRDPVTRCERHQHRLVKSLQISQFWKNLQTEPLRHDLYILEFKKLPILFCYTIVIIALFTD